MSRGEKQQGRSDTEPALAHADWQEQFLELSAAWAPMAGFLGPVGAVAGAVYTLIASGLSADRKFKRLVEVLLQMEEEVKALTEAQSNYVNMDYVAGEDFQDLMAKALLQAADERREEKRRFYARYMAGLVGAEPAPYEERQQQLRTLDELQLRHLEALRFLAESGSTIPGRSRWVIENMETLDQLNSMGLIHWDIASSQARIKMRRQRAGQEATPEIQGGQISRNPHVLEDFRMALVGLVSPPWKIFQGPADLVLGQFAHRGQA